MGFIPDIQGFFNMLKSVNVVKTHYDKNPTESRHTGNLPQYIRQLLTAIKEEIDSNTIIVGDFNTSLTPMERSSIMKINKKTEVFMTE